MLGQAVKLMKRGLCTGDICDAMQQLSMDNGCMSPSIKPLAPGMKAAGKALTCHAPNGAYHTVLKAFYAARPGDVIVVSSGSANTAVMGDLFIRSCISKGLSGMVTDGCFRDAGAIRKLGFPVFAGGVVPRAETRFLAGQVNVQVQCGGVVVNPKDIVYADDDGVVVLPSKHVDKILEVAWRERRSEQTLLRKALKRRAPPHEIPEIRAPFEANWDQAIQKQRERKLVP